NFLYDKPLPKSMIRMTCLANFDGWSGLPEAEYVAAKAEWLPRIHREVLQFVPDFRDRIVFTDFFTPRTIKQWTGHLNGAVYGMPGKIKTGRTHLEHHYNIGGMATWLKRNGGHIFDTSLHGFPIGMVKTCRKYWTPDIAESVVQLKGIRFDNPQFSFTTTFDRADFTDKLVTHFK